MCGIVGEFKLAEDSSANEEFVADMQNTIHHRGPNDDGRILSGSCCLGFRRLSIIDLEGGHQPIANEDDTVWVTLNGEIYNFRDLRQQLEERGHRFRTDSDSEVIAHLYEEYGLDFCKHLRGMFGIALYDIRERRLVLARDRFGIKPIYYWQDTSSVIYGSEIKAILAHPSVAAKPNEEGIFQFLFLRHTLEPDTMFSGIRKLPAGSILVAQSGNVKIQQFWTMPHVRPSELVQCPEAALDQYRESLTESVDLHLQADVPVGIFLSGGLDSSVIAALAQQSQSTPLTCFTAQFKGLSNDETAYARTVANHIGAVHHAVPIEPPSPEILEEIVWHLDEPLGDPACLPTFLLSKECARDFRVVLTGEGSDETNSGYASFLRYQLFHDRVWTMNTARFLWPLLQRSPRQRDRFSRYQKMWEADNELGRILANGQIDSCSPKSVLGKTAPGLLGHRPGTVARLQHLLSTCSAGTPLHRLLEYSRSVFMREDLLMKVDRMTMAHGLEARVPYLDHPTAELAATFSPEILIRDKQTKTVLRDLAKGLLPEQITNRRQHGFLVPLDRWFNDSFTSFASGLLDTETVQRRELFCPESVTTLLKEYQQTGKHSRMIWSLTLLELWFRKFID